MPRPNLTLTVSFRLAMAMLAAFATASTATAQPPKGTVYVQSNVAAGPGNQIIGFKRDGVGTLTQLPGSPYSTGGAGISPSFNLGPYDSDSEIVASADGSIMYVTNGGSNSIAAFTFKGDGSLLPLRGSPFSSGGSNPVAMSLSGDKMVVVNQDNDPGHPGLFLPSYTTLRIESDGALKTIKGASYYVDLGSSPSQGYIPYTDPSLVFGCEFLGGLLRSFQLQSNGALSLVNERPLPAAEFADTGAPPLPLGLWSSPNARILYVGFVTINRMGVYRYDKKGNFAFLRSVPNSGNGICWIRSNREGTRLYTSNTVDPSISVYDTSIDPSEPIEIQKFPLSGMSNVYQITLDPSEKWFYAVTQRNSAGLPASANALHVLKVAADGTLSEGPSSPTILNVPSDSRPQGVLAF